MNLKKCFFAIVTLIIANCYPIYAQGSVGDESDYELTALIDLPTVGILKKGDVGTSFDVLNNGTLITKVELAIIKNLMFGFSYGGSNIIGIGKPDFYSIPAINAKFRLFTETRRIPSITVGFNSQGKGLYADSLDRYEIKSPGVFLAFSKNFKFLGYFTFHGLVNYSLENDDGDSNINFGIGIEKTVGPTISIIAEYDLALNDNSGKSFGDGSGYLNTGLRWSASGNLTLGLDFRNLLDNKKYFPNQGGERAFNIQYIINLY